ncbi:MAG: hypothetical protein PHC45_05210 [Clostridiaceae bacterium]|nr:hypothetical protein [Clostridiaceae bacterium]
MTRKKHSLLKAAIIITLIFALNLLGISYGYWQDSLVGEIKANTGYIELSFGEEIDLEEEESEVFSGLRAELKDDKTIRVSGSIKNGECGEFEIGYSVFNNGSLPVIFDEIQVEDPEIDGYSIIKGSDGMDIGPRDSLTDSIRIQVDTSSIQASQGNGIETSDSYEFEIVLHYYFSSWEDELTIIGDIKVMSIPMPAAAFTSVQRGIATDNLPEGQNVQESYDDGGTTEELDEPEGEGDGADEEESDDREQEDDLSEPQPDAE